ncbi:TetR/AcrR family transcriptional regulator [Streptomyces sp. NPDC058683]|uniref:TetR/AcrR family transcriptional regulator n=1 Tax=Streptomyces sp. NPDC058683 TaxID=3346597 RepID=UPI0036670B69
MSEATATPKQPTTAAQRARVRRILDVATTLVTGGGEEALQMSDLPELADVSLAALYRYFPSKQHLLFAVVENHLGSILARTEPQESATASARERIAAHLLRGFHVDQRVPGFGLTVRRLSTLADPAFSAERQRLAQLHADIVLRAVGPITERQNETLGVVLTASNAAVVHWFAGIITADEARFQILLACRLLDLPEEQIAADRNTAERGARQVSSGSSVT